MYFASKYIIQDMGEASGKKEELSEAYEFGKTLK